MFVLQCIWQPLIVGLEVSVLQACHVIQGDECKHECKNTIKNRPLEKKLECIKYYHLILCCDANRKKSESIPG